MALHDGVLVRCKVAPPATDWSVLAPQGRRSCMPRARDGHLLQWPPTLGQEPIEEYGVTSSDEVQARVHHQPAAPDLYLLDELLSNPEKDVRDRVRGWGETNVLPVINDYWERADFPRDLICQLGELGVVGGEIDGYGCPGLSATAVGLIAMELSRTDGSVSTGYGVHSGLAMHSIARLGSTEQKERWLPPMASMDVLGAFGLTEPQHGSDAVALETRAHRSGDGYVLSGQKRWIGNASIADVIVVWARDDDGEVGGFLVDGDTPGLSTTVITGKTSKRAVWQADVELDNVEIPGDRRLAGSDSFADTTEVLTATRYTVAWEALGHADAAYGAALAYATDREQFRQPVASFQLVQDKLARMAADITTMQLLCLRLSQLVESGRVTAAQASLAKMHCAKTARRVVADARDIMGGNGILLENHVARHQADMEAVYTYEGTDAIQALIVGREITGLSAIA